MDKYCDEHPTCKLYCPACNGLKGGRMAKGARSIRKTISCRINAKRPRPGRRKKVSDDNPK